MKKDESPPLTKEKKVIYSLRDGKKGVPLCSFSPTHRNRLTSISVNSNAILWKSEKSDVTKIGCFVTYHSLASKTQKRQALREGAYPLRSVTERNA